MNNIFLAKCSDHRRPSYQLVNYYFKTPVLEYGTRLEHCKRRGCGGRSFLIFFCLVSSIFIASSCGRTRSSPGCHAHGFRAAILTGSNGLPYRYRIRFLPFSGRELAVCIFDMLSYRMIHCNVVQYQFVTHG